MMKMIAGKVDFEGKIDGEPFQGGKADEASQTVAAQSLRRYASAMPASCGEIQWRTSKVIIFFLPSTSNSYAALMVFGVS